MFRRLWRAFYRRAVADRYSGDTRVVRFMAAAGVSERSRILDVGCGEGEILRRLLAELGVRAEGVEVNPATAAAVRAQGFVCYAPGARELEEGGWDALVMSHVIEHFAYEPLVSLLDGYLAHLAVGGVLVVATPLMHPRFYDDCDHVRPYPPQALGQLFGELGQQVQRQLPQRLDLVDVWFRRSAFELPEGRSSLLGRRGLRHAANLLLLAFFYATLGAVGRRTGWVGLYRRSA